MLQLIITPTKIEGPQYESELEFVIPTDGDFPTKGKHLRPGTEVLRKARPPVVTLGYPRCLGQFGIDFPLLAEAKKLAERADYFLVRLACSFRPLGRDQIHYAKLSVYLQPLAGKLPPIAFDLYPRSVYKPVESVFKVSIAPGLKFAEVAEISVGEASATIQYQELLPVIIGTGVQQSDPCWEFERARGQPIRGARFLYLIVERPREADAIRVIIDLTADVETRHGILAARIKQEDRNHLSSVICDG
jgi:hypothetical protein